MLLRQQCERSKLVTGVGDGAERADAEAEDGGKSRQTRQHIINIKR